MRLSIFSLHQDVAEIDFRTVYLRDAVDGFDMTLFGKILPRGGSQYGVTILDLDASIALGFGDQKYIGDAKPLGGGTIWSHGQGEGQVHLRLKVSSTVLEDIEAARQGGDLKLHFGMRGLATMLQDAEYVKAGLHVLMTNSEPVSFSRSDWENALESTGYSKLVRFALNIPKVQYSANVTEAYKHLDKAQKLLRQAHYRETIETCRLALNLLRNGNGLRDKDLFQKASGQEKENMTEPERIALVRAATQLLSQSGPHPGEVPEEMPVTYAKAAAVLHLTGLAAWLEEQRVGTKLKA